MDLVVLSLAKKGAKQYTDTVIGNLPKGVVYRGSVNYYTDLPNNAEIGDCYTVLYTGESGSNPFGAEYVWGVNTATSTNEWTQIGQDLTNYVKNTDYASSSTGGVIKDGSQSLGYGITQNGANAGKLNANILTYQQYQNNLYTNGFIGKGTLENVLAATVGDIETLLTTLDTGSGV